MISKDKIHVELYELNEHCFYFRNNRGSKEPMYLKFKLLRSQSLPITKELYAQAYNAVFVRGRFSLPGDTDERTINYFKSKPTHEVIPIAVERIDAKVRIRDGHHRVIAFSESNRKEIPAIFVQSY